MAMQRWMMTVVGVVLALPAYAQEPSKPRVAPLGPQAASGALTVLYRIAGVRDSGGQAFSGVATYFSCSNSSSADEKIRFVVRNFDATVKVDSTFLAAARRNFTVSTNYTYLAGADSILLTGYVGFGTAIISSTTTNITCSAMIVDAGGNPPNFAVALHLQRFNPLSGTQE